MITQQGVLRTPCFVFLGVRKLYPIGLHVLAALTLLPFLALAAYCHPYFDDYSTALEVKRTGFATYFGQFYLHWTGRYAFLLANALHPLHFGGIPAYKAGAAGLIVGLVGGCYFMTSVLGRHLAGGNRLVLGSSFLLAVLMLFPSPAEGFYWVIGGYNYLLPISLGLVGLGLGLMRDTLGKKHRFVWQILVLGSTFLFPGFSEFSACLSLLLAVGLMVAYPNTSRFWKLVALTAVVGAVLTLASPGNFVRLHQQHYAKLPAIQLVASSVAATAYTLLQWLSFTGIWLLVLLILPLLQELARFESSALNRLTRLPWLWPMLMGGGLLGCYLFSYFAVHQPLPLRARNLLYVYFLTTGMLSLAGLTQRLHQRQQKLPEIPSWLLLAGLVAVIYLDHNPLLRHAFIGKQLATPAEAYVAWLSGAAQRFDSEQNLRYDLLRRTKADSVQLPALSNPPAILLYYDLSDSPTMWSNQVMAIYFGKKAVWVRPPAKASD